MIDQNNQPSTKRKHGWYFKAIATVIQIAIAAAALIALMIMAHRSLPH